MTSPVCWRGFDADVPVPDAKVLRENGMVFDPVLAGSNEGSDAGTAIGIFSEPVELRLMS
ncbi:unannotated protein [freshwater metagenome]|uniref:Unannotated protein n=1 Tax=freshwater metagenome TaxID=449393 RepID=A0A6J7IZ52_9ZZZZ